MANRERLNRFVDMDGNKVYEGDKVIVAVYTGGFVVGRVVEDGITGVFRDDVGDYGHYKVKVEILRSTPRKSNSTMTYDDARYRMLKLPDGFLD